MVVLGQEAATRYIIHLVRRREGIEDALHGVIVLREALDAVVLQERPDDVQVSSSTLTGLELRQELLGERLMQGSQEALGGSFTRSGHVSLNLQI